MFPVVENSKGIVGQVELRTDNANYYNSLEITSYDPPSMIGNYTGVYRSNQVNYLQLFEDSLYKVSYFRLF